MGQKKISKQLAEYFRRKRPYLNRDLRLTDIASALGISENLLSASIGKAYSLNFSQLCNRYRIRHICRRFICGSSGDFKKLYRQSGFSSYSAFAEAFSRNIRATPGKWCRSVRKRQALKERVSIAEYI